MRDVLVSPVIVNLLLLLTAGVGKLMRPEPFARALGQIGVRPARLLARAAAVAELATVALTLFVGPLALLLADLAVAGTAVLMARRTPEHGCGCFGAEAGRPVGAAHLAVTGGMLVVGVLAVAAGIGPADLSAGSAVATLTVVALSAVMATLLRSVLDTQPRERAA